MFDSQVKHAAYDYNARPGRHRGGRIFHHQWGCWYALFILTQRLINVMTCLMWYLTSTLALFRLTNKSLNEGFDLSGETSASVWSSWTFLVKIELIRLVKRIGIAAERVQKAERGSVVQKKRGLQNKNEELWDRRASKRWVLGKSRRSRPGFNKSCTFCTSLSWWLEDSKVDLKIHNDDGWSRV